MKKNFSVINLIPEKLSGTRSGAILWLSVHLLLLLPGLGLRQIGIDTSFFSILPIATEDPVLAETESFISQNLNNRIRILVGSKSLSQGKIVARELSEELGELDGIERIEWLTPENTFDEIRLLIHQNRYKLLNSEDLQKLENGNADLIVSDALMQVFSPVSFARLDHLDEDPFLLTDRILFDYLDSASNLGGSFVSQDGVLVAEYDDWYYIQVSIVLNSQSPQSRTVRSIETLVDEAITRSDDIDIIVSGFPVHNADSSSRASREISIISTICLVLLVVILISTFRSPLPVWVSIVMIVVAAGAAFSSTLLIFGSIHLFTLVFGTSLIGISIDYALHYFVFRTNHPGNSSEIITKILPGIGLGMVTTVISYIALLATPIPLLRQISVFSIVGLVSSFLSVVIIFPMTSRKRNERRIGSTDTIEGMLDRFASIRPGRRKIILVITLAFVLMFASGISILNLNNDVKTFYTMSDELAEAEMKAALIAGTESLSRYFIVLGDSPQDLLQRESSLTRKLDKLVAMKELGSWIGLSRFVPTLAEQEASFQLVRTELLPLVADQFLALGYTSELANDWSEDLQASRDRYVYPEDILDIPSLASLNDVWVGRVGERYASIVMVGGYKDSSALAGFAGRDIYWNESVEDISRTLQHNSKQALILIGVAYAVIFIFLSIIEGLVPAFRICLVPVAAGLMSAGLIGWLGAPFNLFAVFGLILALGIGIDYSIFMSKGGHDRGGTFLAIALSCLSTVLSFGALSLSSFTPVADFGRAVLWGVIFSFILAPLIMTPVKNTGK